MKDVAAVAFTYRELKALQDRVDADFELLRGRGIEVALVGVDIAANRLRIEVTGLEATARMYLQYTYGPRVIEVEGGPWVTY